MGGGSVVIVMLVAMVAIVIALVGDVAGAVMFMEVGTVALRWKPAIDHI